VKRVSNPVAVLISDVHYNLQTLPVADAAMRMAIGMANDHDVPLVVCGDLHDTKANLRGECVNALIATFDQLAGDAYILRGNHDALNERSTEHSLSFLGREHYDDKGTLTKNVIVVNKPGFYNNLGAVRYKSVHMIPYQSDPDEARRYLKKIDKGSCVIMHQGLTGSAMGDYIQDKSAINPQDAKGLRVISGHYHTRQTRDFPSGGRWDYVGNPYTLSFGEASDPPKGFQVLMDDGSLEFVPTNLRKHVVVERHLDDVPSHGIGPIDCGSEDLLWVKLKGSREQLSRVIKRTVYNDINRVPFRLDLIPTDSAIQVTSAQASLSGGALLDSIIDGLSDTSDQRKTRLKSSWKDLCG